ncbi:MAG: molybdenum cofactor guanylyltransferase [Marinilabiliales bacterium]
MTKFNNICGVILAGGKNLRYHGTEKAFLKINGKTIIENTLDILKQVFNEILIISNKPEKYTAFSLPVFTDIYRNLGPIGGIHSALHNTRLDAIMVFASDMPFLNKEFINYLIEYFYSVDCDILIPCSDKGIEPLHAIYRKSIIKKLDTFIKETNDYAISKLFPVVNTKFIKTDKYQAKLSFVNINSPEDIKKIMQ